MKRILPGLVDIVWVPTVWIILLSWILSIFTSRYTWTPWMLAKTNNTLDAWLVSSIHQEIGQNKILLIAKEFFLSALAKENASFHRFPSTRQLPAMSRWRKVPLAQWTQPAASKDWRSSQRSTRLWNISRRKTSGCRSASGTVLQLQSFGKSYHHVIMIWSSIEDFCACALASVGVYMHGLQIFQYLPFYTHLREFLIGCLFLLSR